MTRDSVAYRRDRFGSGVRAGSGRCLGGVGEKGGCAAEAPAVDAEPPNRRPQTLQDRRPSPRKTENPGLHGHQTDLEIRPAISSRLLHPCRGPGSSVACRGLAGRPCQRLF